MRGNMRPVKKTGAVIAGFLTVVILSVATDAALEAAGIFPPSSQPGLYDRHLLLLAFAYRSLYAVGGGFVTAKLSPATPGRPVMMLGILGTLGGIGGVIYGWDLSEHWYPVALAVTAYPLTWWGGTLGMKRPGTAASDLPA